MQAEEFNASDLGNNWYEHEQFGTFYDANNSDWYYHLDHGWIYVDEWDDNGTWMYMPLVDETPVYPYQHFDGNNYTTVLKWEELAASTGMSIDFFKAIAEQSGNDPSLFENEGNQTINVTDTAEPFGWVWTNSSTQNFLYNNRLEEWFYINKDIPKSEARYYSYNQKCYVTPKEIRKRDYAQDVWREMLSNYGLDKLNDLNRGVGIDENKLEFSDGTPVIITVDIPKVEIQEDDLWFPLIKTLTEQQIVLKKYYRLSEDENFYRLEIRSVLLNEVINTSSHQSTKDTNHEVDVPDDERQTLAKGLDDNSSKEAILLEKAGIIDLNDADYERKLDKYIEVAKVASNKFEEKVQGRDAYRKDAERFTRDLVSNFEQVVDLVIETESIGIQDDTVLDSLLENSDNTKEVNEIQKEAQNLGIRDKQTLEAVFRNADKADELKEVLDVARETLGEDDGLGGKKLDSSKASILLSTFKNADKADSMKSVMDDAKNLGLQDATYLTGVFENADKADDLRVAMENAKVIVCYAADYIGPVLKNTPQVNSLNKILTTFNKGETDKNKLAELYKNAEIADEMLQVIDKAEEISDEKLEEIQKAVAVIEVNINLEEQLALAFRNTDILVEHKTDPLDILLSSVNAGPTGTWSIDEIIVEGTSLGFSGDATGGGDVVLENVTHSAVSDLNSTEFKLYTEQY